MMEQKLTHFNAAGEAHMVDVGGKAVTGREAVAEGCIHLGKDAFHAVAAGTAKKGDVLGVARIAGIMAAKRTADIIPLCHPIAMSHCAVEFALDEHTHTVRCTCTTRCAGQTGVEMEALHGVSAALLTIYDMCKAIDRGMEITDIRLLHKAGGKSGVWNRKEELTNGND